MKWFNLKLNLLQSFTNKTSRSPKKSLSFQSETLSYKKKLLTFNLSTSFFKLQFSSSSDLINFCLIRTSCLNSVSLLVSSAISYNPKLWECDSFAGFSSSPTLGLIRGLTSLVGVFKGLIWGLSLGVAGFFKGNLKLLLVRLIDFAVFSWELEELLGIFSGSDGFLNEAFSTALVWSVGLFSGSVLEELCEDAEDKLSRNKETL